MSRNLIYFVCGANPDYASLLKTCIESIRATCTNNNTDLLVLCDENYQTHVAGLGTFIHITEPNLTGVDASMRKVEIFDYPRINQYAAVLYLDCDIVVCKDLAPLFNMIRRDDTLYTCSELAVTRPHELIFFSLLNYTPQQLEFLYSRGKTGFNCGQMAFKVSQVMCDHFACVRRDIAIAKTTNYPFFYEQSFMNYHFNLHGSVDDTVLTHITDLTPWNTDPADANVYIAHFANIDHPWDYKLHHMRKRLQHILQ